MTSALSLSALLLDQSPADARSSSQSNSQLTVTPASSEREPAIVACVTACNECLEEIQYCLETFHGRCPSDLSLDTIYVILDGCPDENMQAGNQTFQDLVSVMRLHVPVGNGGVLREGGCRVYLGKVRDVPARLYVKGRGDIQRSKRRSICAFYDILAQRISSGAAEEPLAVLHMDADTGSATPDGDNSKTGFGLENVAKILRIMRANDDLGAVASHIRVLHRTKNVLALMQNYDVAVTYAAILGGASLVGRSTTCIGMTVMYRYRALSVSNVKGVPSPLSAFTRVPDRSIVDHVNLDMNEDQGMTTFIVRAGYNAKTSVVSRFYTFAPENLAELIGQRRRWQAGFIVGLPYQVLGSPSPHLQCAKLRWVMALMLSTIWASSLLMPGTLGFGLAFFFDEAFVGFRAWWVNGSSSELVHEAEDASLFRQAVFASCVWVFWLTFIATTMGKAPKKIRTRCQFFFTTGCVVSVAVILLAAIVSRTAQVAVCMIMSFNLTVGVAVTYDKREWLHRLQEVAPYFLFTCAIKPMITMYTVANIDSALWGTRSVGNINVAAENTDSTTTTTPTTVTNGAAVAPDTNATGAPQQALVGVSSTADGFRQADTADGIEVAEASAEAGVDGVGCVTRVVDGNGRGGGEGGKRGGHQSRGLSLRARKFVILAAWLVVNMSLTAVFLLFYETVALVGLVGLAGLLAYVFAARVERLRQRRSALPPTTTADVTGTNCPR